MLNEYNLEDFDILANIKTQQESYADIKQTKTESKDEIIQKIKEKLTFYDLLTHLKAKKEQKISCPNPAH